MIATPNNMILWLRSVLFLVRWVGVVALGLVSAPAWGQPLPSEEVDDKAIADESRTSDWLAYGRTHSEQRFSPLKDINVGNIADLGVDWFDSRP